MTVHLPETRMTLENGTSVFVFHETNPPALLLFNELGEPIQADVSELRAWIRTLQLIEKGRPS